MEEIINSPEYQKLLPYLPYVPYILFAVFIRVILEVILCVISRRTLLQIREENRCMQVDQVWLILIPFFCIYWNFMFMRKMVDSLNNEFHDRKVPVEENPTQKSGYFFAGTYLVYNLPVPMFIGFIAYILGIVCLVVYIVKVREYRKLLEEETLGIKDQF